LNECAFNIKKKIFFLYNFEAEAKKTLLLKKYFFAKYFFIYFFQKKQEASFYIPKSKNWQR